MSYERAEQKPKLELELQYLLAYGAAHDVVLEIDTFKNVEGIDWDLVFIQALEDSGGDLRTISRMLQEKIPGMEKEKHLYAIRMFLLFPDKYDQLTEMLREKEVDVSLYEQYRPEVEKLHTALNEIEPKTLDTDRPSIALEIESMNLDPAFYTFTGGLELDTPITNDVSNIVSFVRKIDRINEKLRKEIAKEHFVGIYDSVHINIGIPPEREGHLGKIEYLKNAEAFEALKRLLKLIGLVYNNIGRVAYMYRTPHTDINLVVIDQNPPKGTMAMSERKVKGGYESKLQNRLWSFKFAVGNAKKLKVMLEFMTTILQDYNENKSQIVRELSQKIAESIKEKSPHGYGELINKGHTGDWYIDQPKLFDNEYTEKYLEGRHEIWQFIEKELIKTTEELKAE